MSYTTKSLIWIIFISFLLFSGFSSIPDQQTMASNDQNILNNENFRIHESDVGTDQTTITMDANDYEIRETVTTISNQSSVIYNIQVSADGNLFASVARYYSVKIYNAIDDKFVYNITADVYSVDFSTDSSLFAVAFANSSIHIYNTDTWNIVTKYSHKNSIEGIYSVDFSDDSSLVASGDGSNFLQVRDTTTWDIVYEDFVTSSDIWDVQFSPNGNQLAIGTRGGKLIFLDTSTWEIEQTLELEGWTTEVEYSPNGEMIAIHLDKGINSPNVYMYNTIDYTQVMFKPAGLTQYRTSGLAFTNNNQGLFIGSQNIVLRSVSNPETVFDSLDTTKQITTLAIHPNNEYLFTGHENGDVSRIKISVPLVDPEDTSKSSTNSVETPTDQNSSDPNETVGLSVYFNFKLMIFGVLVIPLVRRNIISRID